MGFAESYMQRFEIFPLIWSQDSEYEKNLLKKFKTTIFKQAKTWSGDTYLFTGFGVTSIDCFPENRVLRTTIDSASRH